MKRINKIILTLLITALLSLTTFFVYSALTDTKEKDSLIFNVGELSYELKGKLVTDEYLIYPGKNYVDEPFIIINKSNIETQIRIKLKVLLGGLPVDDLTEDSFVIYKFGEEWTLIDEYYYIDVPAGEDEILLLESLILDGKVVKNDYSGQKLEIEISFHAKQKDNMTWTQFDAVVI